MLKHLSVESGTKEMKLENIYLPRRKIFNVLFFTVIILVSLFFLLGVLSIQTENDVLVLLPENPETSFEMDKLDRLRKEFPSEQLLFIGLEGKPFSMEKIKRFWQLANEIEKLETVDSTLNPFNATYFAKLGNTFTIRRLPIQSYPKTEEQLQEFMQNIRSNRYLTGSVISYDGNTAGIVVKMNKNLTINTEEGLGPVRLFLNRYVRRLDPVRPVNRTDFCNEVESVLDNYRDDFMIHLAGVPIYESKIKGYMQRDVVKLLLPAFLVMMFVLFINFRSKVGTFFPMIAIMLSMLWTMGFIGWLRYKINIVGILIPPIIMTVGSSYTLHYLYSYYIKSPLHTDTRELVVAATRNIITTIFMASLTTMVGFGSFITGRIDPIRKFGIFIIISISLTLFFTFFLLSKILYRLPPPKNVRFKNLKSDGFSKILTSFHKTVLPLRLLWAGIFITVIILFFIFIPYLKVETNPANFFKNTDQLKKSLVHLTNNFKGVTHFNVTIRHKHNKRNYFKSPEGIASALKVQDYIDENIIFDGKKQLGWNLSPVTLLQDLNKAMTGELGIPEDEKTIRRFYTYMQISKDSGIQSLMNRNMSAITYQIRVHTQTDDPSYLATEKDVINTYNILKQDLNEIAEEDGTFNVEVWGELLIITSISKYLVNDQITSLTITCILVFLITLLLFKSPFYAIFSLVPLGFGVLLNFTIMSMFNIPLDSATVMIAAISIGIGIDNAIHFILNYKKGINKTNDPKQAVLDTLSYTSRPILFTSLALTGGFLVFLFSSFRPIVFFGLLVAVSIFACTFATLFILPSLLVIADPLRRLIHRPKSK
jgi:predicted RND superfamily exporter protein